MSVRDDVVAIGYDASVRALATQEGQLDGLHARASFLLAAAGIATGTVLGTTNDSLSKAGITSVILFGLTAIAATSILFPTRDGWFFTSDANTIIDVGVERSLSKTQTLEWIAKHNQANWLSNKRRLDWRYQMLSLGCVLLIGAIGAAVISLAP